MDSALKPTYDFFSFTKGQPVPLMMTAALQYERLLFDATYQLSLIPEMERQLVLLAVAYTIKEKGFSEIPESQNHAHFIEQVNFGEVLHDFLSNVQGLTDQIQSQITEAFNNAAEQLNKNLKGNLDQGPTTQQEQKIKPVTGEMRTRYRQGDHAVVTDFSSAKGFRVISKVMWKQEYPKMKPDFFGSKKECQRWVDALTPEKRKEVEKEILREFQERIPLPSEVKKSKENDQQVNDVMKKFNLPIQRTLFGDTHHGKGINQER